MSLIDTLANLKLSSLDDVVADSELTNEELALKSQWTTLVSSDSDLVGPLNESLKDKTYIVGTKPTEADIVVFKAVFPKASTYDVAAQRHVLRWIDLVQNTLLDSQLPEDQKLKIDFDAVVPREIKEKKKKKKDSQDGAKPEAKNAAEHKKEKKDDGKPHGKPDAETIARQKAAKAAKKAKKAANKAASEPVKAEPVPSMIDLRVGFIEKAIKHPDADSLYVSTIHMGDDEPRTVCSGLVKYVPLEEMQQRYVIVIANLKPVKMRGIKSSAMVLCASDEDHGIVEFVNPPAGSQAGDKIFFEGYDGTPEKVLTPKKKIWETCQPRFTTNENHEVIYKNGDEVAKLVNKKGEVCKDTTLVAATVR